MCLESGWNLAKADAKGHLIVQLKRVQDAAEAKRSECELNAHRSSLSLKIQCVQVLLGRIAFFSRDVLLSIPVIVLNFRVDFFTSCSIDASIIQFICCQAQSVPVSDPSFITFIQSCLHDLTSTPLLRRRLFSTPAIDFSALSHEKRRLDW